MNYEPYYEIFSPPPTPPLAYREQRLAHDIEWKVLGPMPVEEFLNEFFPVSPDSITTEAEIRKTGVEPGQINFAAVPDSPDKEEEMYDGLCRDLNRITGAAGFIFCDASKHTKKPDEPGPVKLDIGLFGTEDKDRGHLFSIKKPSGYRPSSYVAHMGQVCMFIEIKTNADQGVFTDPPLDPPSDYKFTVDTWSKREDAKNRISPLNQNAGYARIIQTLQFRTRLFSLTISGSTARLMRWDRSGVLVTQAFDYKASPQTLINFVWRFIKSTRVLQGFDPTAKTVDSDKDRNEFREAITSHVQVQLALGPEAPELEQEVGKHYSGTLTRLAIGGRNVWVSRPSWVSHAIVGRCTAGYWGVRCDTKEVVFAKGVWHTPFTEEETEGGVMTQLKEKRVSQIPTVVCHGGVPTKGESLQTTRTDEFSEKPWVKSLHPRGLRSSKIFPRVHYRLVVDVAGYPLSAFKGSRELFKGTYDCFIAVIDAVGYLVEHACKPSEVVVSGMQLGTPAFMSIVALSGTNHAHDLKDDLEPFIYIILYAALRWLPSSCNLSPGYAAKFVSSFDRSYTSRLQDVGNTQAVEWLNNAMDLHYKERFPNPLWEDGKALKKMWEEYLTRDLPLDNSCVNPVEDACPHEDQSLGATYSVTTSALNLYGQHCESVKFKSSKSIPTKRSPDEDGRDPQSSKRSRRGKRS